MSEITNKSLNEIVENIKSVCLGADAEYLEIYIEGETYED